MADLYWSFFFPGQGGTREDAIPIVGRISDAESAAEQASDYDFNNDPSDDAFDNPQEVVVISPDGVQSHWRCWCEPEVSHHATRVDR